MTPKEALWSRSPYTAFVDDGADRVVLLDMRDLRAARPTLLAGPSAAIWRAIEGRCSEDQIVERAAEAFAEPDFQVLKDVRTFLRDLRAKGLLIRVSN